MRASSKPRSRMSFIAKIMKRVWAVVFIGALLLQSAEGARRRPLPASFASSRALAILGALVLQSGGLFIEGRPPHPSPPPNPPRPTPPAPSPPSSPPPTPNPPGPTPPSPSTPSPPAPPPPSSPPPPPPAPNPPPPPPPTTANCTQLGQLSEGPYWIEENIEAADVRSNLSYGIPLNLTLKIANETLSELQGSCVPIEQARVDLWQCRYDGLYSDEEEESTAGETWLRGYQYTNSTGHATFYTIFPGWYTSRTVHIHVRVRIYEEDGNTTSYDDTTQFFFDDAVTTAIFNDVYPYNSRGYAVRDTFNTNDPLFTTANVLTLTGSYNDTDGYSSVVELSLPFTTTLSIGANGKSISSSSGGFVAIS